MTTEVNLRTEDFLEEEKYIHSDALPLSREEQDAIYKAEMAADESADDVAQYGGFSWNDLVAMLAIDELKLDEELKNQAVLFQIVVEQAVGANRALNTLKYEKEQLKIRTETLIAATSLQTRSNADASGTKTTEGKVEETVKANAHVVEIKNQLADADYEIAEAFTNLLRWESLRKSYEERSLSLRGMVSLITSGYAAYSRS